jgi:hypothetical protein
VQAARGDTVTGTDAATGADVVIDGTWSCRRPHRRFPTRSGLSFRDPDNIALELFAPPGYVTRRVESAMHLARAVAAIMARSTWPPTGSTSPVRRSVETDVGSLLTRLGLRDRAEAAEPSRRSTRWKADDRTRGRP